MQYPVGKGMMIWQFKRLLNETFWGSPDAMVARAKELGFQWVAPKVQSGVYVYQSSYLHLIDAFVDAGIQVWGWGYVYGGTYSGTSQAVYEGNITNHVLKTYKLSGFLIDAEAEYKRSGSSAWAKAYMQRVRLQNPTTPIGLCSYRYPSLHREIPWSQFLAYCDFHAPQVYWEQSQNSAAQLVRSYNELTALKKLPVVPLGSAYKRGTWMPSKVSMNAFDNKVKELSLPGVSWWAWYNAERNNLANTIGQHEWDTGGGIGTVPIPQWAQELDEWARTKGYAGNKPAGSC